MSPEEFDVRFPPEDYFIKEYGMEMQPQVLIDPYYPPLGNCFCAVVKVELLRNSGFVVEKLEASFTTQEAAILLYEHLRERLRACMASLNKPKSVDFKNHQ